MIVASVGSTAVRSGTIIPPRSIINFFLLAKGTRLWTVLLSWRLNLRNFRFLQFESFTLPFKTFNAHSQNYSVVFCRYLQLLLSVICDVRLSERVVYESWTLCVSSFIAAYTMGDVRPEKHWFQTAVYRQCLGRNRNKVTVRAE